MTSKSSWIRLLRLTSRAATLSPCGAANQAAAKVKFFPILLALLQCKNEPPAPAPATATDGEVARPEINLMAAGCDCLERWRASRALQG
jgi:hypothetical protein